MKLRTKTVIGVAVIEAIAAAVLLYLMLSYIADTNYDAAEKRAQSTADLLASSLTDAVLAFDLATIEAVAKTVISQEDITHVRVIERSGIAMTEVFKDGQDSSQQFAVDAANTLEATAPIALGDELRADVFVGMSTAYIPKLISDARQRGLMVAGTEMLLVALFSGLLGIYLTRKLKRLEDAAKRIGEGDLSTPIPFEGQDEVDGVAEALESMRAQVEQARSDLLKAKDIVEAKNFELTEAHKKRNQLFGMVAHELRTPVAAISMMTDHIDDLEWGRDRKHIQESAKDLLNTIDDMRLLINPELPRPVRRAAFTIKELNGGVAASVASIVAATGVQYQQYNATPMALVDDELSTDTYRVRVAVTNIVKNACLHSGGTRVWLVSRLYTDQGEDFLEWLVGDNGSGIPEDQVERLFNAGERGDSKAEGSGLGLHITKSWIEEIGGAVQYRSGVKSGSEFMIRVPLIRANNAHSEEDVVNTDRLEQLMGQLNVLMLEDEAMLRLLGQKLVSKLVASVQVAENGSDGLKVFDPSKHNLVLTDYFMPEITGVEFARRLRGLGYTGVIIGVTAATLGDQRDEMLQAGVDMVLLKPLNAEMFKNSIAQLMAAGRFDDLRNGEASS